MTHMDKVRAARARTDVHFNCAQALLVGFSDVCNLTEEEAFNLGAGFGAGMASGETCGALTAATMILGLATDADISSMKSIRKNFESKHVGTQCRDLLAASARAGITRKEHCDGLVFEVGEQLEELLG